MGPTNIMISFSSFDTERDRDFVTINECSSASCATRRQLARLSGSAVSANTNYTASTGFLEVVFRSDDRATVAATYTGFEAAWTLGSIKTIMMTKCLECPAGTYTDASGSSSCTECLAGSFQNETGATGCVTCDCGKQEKRAIFSGASSSRYCVQYCEEKEELEKRKAQQITTASLVFVVVGLICELYTANSILNWKHLRIDASKIWILFLADVAFSVAKLFPGVAYNCHSWSCRKVTHVCTMTLCSFLFQLVEVYILRTMTRDQGTKVPVLVKLVEYSASLAFVIYDAATQDPPGVGTTVLIVFASLAEILLLAMEAHTFWTYRRPEAAVGPLIAQTQLGEYDKVQRLLQDGADANAANAGGELALPIAAKQGRQDLVKLLLDFKADLGTSCEPDGRDALHLASGEGHLAVVQTLLEHCANVAARDKNEETSLHRSSWKGHHAVVQTLLEHGADVAARTKSGWTSLLAASDRGHHAVVQTLLEHGSDVSARNKDKETSLHKASEKGHPAVVQTLLEHGADVAARTNWESTSLHLASKEEHLAVVQTLLEHGADVTARDKVGAAGGRSCRWLRRGSGACAWVPRAGERRRLPADRTPALQYDETSLHMVSNRQRFRSREVAESLVKMLLEHGADVAARNKFPAGPGEVGACACTACRVREDRRLSSIYIY
jgi:ankyrin repeat protein